MENAIVVKMDDIVVNEYNPNEMDEELYNELVIDIRRNGLINPLTVAPADDGKYILIDGEHRYRAARDAGIEEVPCLLFDFDDDEQKVHNIRWNVLHGQINPVKFTALFDSLVERYGKTKLRSKMGLTRDKAFDNLYKKVHSSLPAEYKKRLDERKDEIQSVADLSRIVNAIMQESNDTLKYGYICFTFGGKTSYMIRMNAALHGMMEELTQKSIAEERNINDIMIEHFGRIVEAPGSL